MNREILFRGKRVDNGEWVYGYLAGYDLIAPDEPESTENATGAYYGDTPYVGFVDVYPNTVGQYIGLTDKTGKCIFDGDILRQKRYGMSEESFSVVWNTDGAGWYFFDEDGYTDELWQSICDSCEIIGNVHDNPDMLTDKGE